MASDLIERVARAMHCPDHVAKEFILATLEGMRGPSDAVIKAGDRIFTSERCYSFEDILPDAWHAMLDAIRAEVERAPPHNE